MGEWENFIPIRIMWNHGSRYFKMCTKHTLNKLWISTNVWRARKFVIFPECIYDGEVTMHLDVVTRKNYGLYGFLVATHGKKKQLNTLSWMHPLNTKTCVRIEKKSMTSTTYSCKNNPSHVQVAQYTGVFRIYVCVFVFELVYNVR